MRYGDQSAQLKAIREDPQYARWSFSSQQQTLRRLDRAFAAFFARVKRGSTRRRKAAQRVAALHRLVANSRRDHLHKVSRRMVDTYDLIVLEALRVKNMTRSARGTVESPGSNVAAKSGLNRSINDAGWGVLQEMLRYKAEEAGVEVLLVNPANTSRTCHLCGHVAAENRNREAFRCVRCGHIAHADTNAARNILRLGLSLRQTAPAA